MDVKGFAIREWYGKFSKLTVKTVFISVDDLILNYLSSDGIYLPEDYQQLSSTDSETKTSLNRFVTDVDLAIKQLGGQVIPKFTWSVPKDATWISHDKSLKCINSDEVLLLLKSSNQITHDIDYALGDGAAPEKSTINHVLALRKWVNVNPCLEFRCFVRNNCLIAISQRNVQQFFPEIIEKSHKIKSLIIDFINSEIKNKFFVENFTLDVFLTDHIVKLLDFNPYGHMSHSLLYTYEELDKVNILNDRNILFRYITSQKDVKANLHIWDAYPEDFLHLHGGLDINKFIDFMNLKENCNTFENGDCN
ncbi:hypothetical protein HELRODRAFT_85046 [Helobdella robusta]|uniref:Uncharacterized protein n=1 Tax=Helobdella robusta TaxID=6412 RepID=T1G5S0_HELRO|nr:hypothetical protein HELRODRAFT_85046 [Helobdella robusta]ESN97883.1 hypothetical protein HELRODRAFT_85046 [Helobdella robusta]